jgi:uncharacterized protein DUF1566
MRCLRTRAIIVIAAVLVAAEASAGTIPSWDDKVTVGRFRVLREFNDAAVLDRETGLVWERSPSSVTHPWSGPGLSTAAIVCNTVPRGGRLGWRLPTIQELASLVDPTQSSPALPHGHPFTNVQSSFYWSATTGAGQPGTAWNMTFNGAGAVSDGAIDGSNLLLVWCVRSPLGVDAQ